MSEVAWVTGANGMVGRSIAMALAAEHADWKLLLPTRAQVDLTDRAQVRRFIAANSPTLIVHAAGRVGGIAANVAKPVEFLLENMHIGMNVIGEARDAAVYRLINISSSCTYPRDHQGLLGEELMLSGPLEPTNEGYAVAKIAADRLCAYIAAEDGLEYRTLVPSNLYGPGDHFDDNRGHLIANVIRKVHAAKLNSEPTVTIWGDGTARREFTFVGDVAQFISKLLGSGRLATLPQRVNIGVGEDWTVNEYYQTVADVVGWEGAFEHDFTKPSGMPRKLMDSALARKHGWAPRTSLEDGLRLTYEYYLKTLEGA